MKMVEYKYKNKRVLMKLDDQHLAQHVERYNKPYEHLMLEFIEQNFSGGTFIDCGANIGNHSLFFSLFCNAEKVYAFEPIIHNYELLQYNSVINGCSNITSILSGLACEKGFAGFTKSNTQRWSQVELSFHDIGNIPVTRLDDYMFSGVSLIKIDCEGMERSIVRGAAQLITKQTPDMFIEIVEKDSLTEISEFLFSLGYRIISCFNSTPTYHFSASPRFKKIE